MTGTADLSRLVDGVLANTSTAVVTVDICGIMRYLSPGAGSLLGYDTASTAGSSIFELLHPADADRAAQLFAQRLAHRGADLGHQLRIRHASGEFLDVEVTVMVLPESPLGAAALTLNTGVDAQSHERSLGRRLVVEQFCNRLAADLMEAKQHVGALDQLERSLGEVAMLTGSEVVSVFLERHEGAAVERMVRWITPELARNPGFETVAVDDQNRGLETALAEMIVIDDHAQHPPWLRHLLGEQIPAFFLSAPFVAGAQRGALVMMRFSDGPVWSDSDTLLARNVANLFGRALSAARTEELLALTYAQGPVAFSIRTWEGTFVDCNQQYLDLYGLTREQAQSANVRQLIHPKDWPAIRELRKGLKQGEVDQITYESRCVGPDGGWHWVRMRAQRLDRPGSTEQFVLTSLEDITEMRAQRVELEHAARNDSLTGVASRHAMSEAIDRFAADSGRLPNLLFIDLDRFKLINDSVGHVAGDNVLRAVADRILAHVRKGDLVARLGGDEFAVVVSDPSTEGAITLAERLRRSMEEPIEVDGRVLPQTISIGVAFGTQCATSRELLVRADRAMYVAKETGRNRSLVFDDSMRDETIARLRTERELRYAIDHGELDVYFQPEFSVGDRSIVGAEALLRWHHPDRGLIVAGQFIDVAEATGMIDEIGRFALREACRSFAAIAGTDSPLTLRINISAREFARPELGELVRSALASSGLSPARLCLEMTETTLMDSPEVALETFERLHDIGVQFAIDDFGTGYSSLVYLKRFPVDAIKIDRGFVEELTTSNDNRAIVESIIGLGRALSLEVVAEGVETAAQLELLHELGCERAQGYLVSPGLPAHEFVTLLTSDAPTGKLPCRQGVLD